MARDASRPWIMGLASSHNGAVCLLHGDEIVVAIQEERLLRVKRAPHRGALKSLAIRYCLETANITPADLFCVVQAVSGSSNRAVTQDVSLNPMLQLSRYGVPTAVVGHHTAHAIGAFATSGFPDAAVLVVDGSGSFWSELPQEERRLADPWEMVRYSGRGRGPVMETVSMYMADGVNVVPIAKHVGSKDLRPKEGMSRFWSLGYMYQMVGDQIFGGGLEAAGKLMGLAPYGKPSTPTRDFYSIVDGRFEFLDTVPNRYLHNARWPLRRAEYQDLAASTQRALEDAMFVVVLQLRRMTKARRLCYAGGVALNSVANDLLVRNGGFDDVFIMPAAEDSGTAIGAAYYGLWQLTHRNAQRRLPHDAVGRRYSSVDVERAVDGCPGICSCQPVDIVGSTVELLKAGKIIGWFQGRSELGPRALGQRSILCDPREPAMKDILNSRVKFREAFRPFAPVVPLEHFSSFFDQVDPVESPFMLRVVPFKPDKCDLVPAVVHVDGTGRVQTLTPEANGRFYELAVRFYEETGCPILLNTSFNIAGEPIVETPDDALSCLLLTGLDACVIEDWLTAKAQNYDSVLDLVPKLLIERVGIERRLVAPDSTAMPIASAPRGRLFSTHLEGAAYLEPWIAKRAHDVLRIITKTRWGRVVHVIGVEALDILPLIDGRRNGWEILKSLNDDAAAVIDGETLKGVLGMLRRLSIIEWHDFKPSRIVSTPLSSHLAI